MPDRLMRHSVWIFGVFCTAIAAAYVWVQGLGVDAHAYWLAWRGPMYTTAPGTPDAYLYSPAFAQIMWPLAQLPWPFFVSIFTAGLGIGLAWLLKPLGWKWGLPLWLAGLPEIISGNIFILMAVAAVVSFSKPEGWAFVALTKISPTVGPVWFLVRGEWGQLIRFLLSLAVVAGLSVASAPSLWREWIEFLMMHLGNSTEAIGSPFVPPAIVRVPLGLGLIVWAARKDKRWCIPVAMVLCTPVLWLGSLTLLAAIPRIQEHAFRSAPGAGQNL